MDSSSVKLYLQPWDVESRLRSLGLTQTILREAVRAGEFERSTCTSLNPRPYAGIAAWSWAVARLREQLLPQGWRMEDKRNLPLTIDPVRRTAIVVTSGSPNTGDPERVPTTKNPKGRMTANQVKTNHRQLILGFPDAPRLIPLPGKAETITWLFLIFAKYNAKTEDFTAKSELSLPGAIDPKGYVCEWAERIILEPVLLDDIALGQTDDGDQDENAQGIDVPVKRR